jgi:hypothetical protein
MDRRVPTAGQSDEIAIDAPRAAASLRHDLHRVDTAARRARRRPTDFATIGRPASRAASGNAPSRAAPDRDRRSPRRRRPLPATASAVAYALSLFVNTTAR